ncbi:hypothetical protein D3C72_2573620 [compost metagenome]
MDELRQHYKSDIDRNINKWDKQKKKSKTESHDDELNEDILDESHESWEYVDEGFEDVEMTY